MKKKLLLCLALLTAFFSNAQLAKESTFENGIFECYVVTSTASGDATNTVRITGFATGATEPAALTIPSTITEASFDYDVTFVGSNAFKDNTTITSLSIPAGSMEIQFRTFQGCTNLESADLAGVTANVQNNAFLNCSKLTTVTMDNLTGIIGVSAFQNCTLLTSISASNATSLGNSAIRSTTALTSVNFDSVTSIGTNVFQESGLTTISLPSATYIGNYAFLNSSLASIDMPVVETIKIGAFNGTDLTSVTLPSTLTALEGNNTFKNSTSLAEVIVEFSTPIALTAGCFDNIAATNKLVVPEGTVASFEAAAVWTDFGTIEEPETLGVKSSEADFGWSIYVNSSQDIVSLTNAENNNAHVVVYNLTGATVLAQSVNKAASDINISGLNTGVYLLKIDTENGSFVKKFIKQ